MPMCSLDEWGVRTAGGAVARTEEPLPSGRPAGVDRAWEPVPCAYRLRGTRAAVDLPSHRRRPSGHAALAASTSRSSPVRSSYIVVVRRCGSSRATRTTIRVASTITIATSTVALEYQPDAVGFQSGSVVLG